MPPREITPPTHVLCKSWLSLLTYPDFTSVHLQTTTKTRLHLLLHRFFLTGLPRVFRQRRRLIWSFLGFTILPRAITKKCDLVCSWKEKCAMVYSWRFFFAEVGNAVTDNYYDNLGTVTYWWSHAMISDRTYHQLISTSDFTQQKESNQCETTYSYAMDQEFENIDQYNIYAPPCNNLDGSTSSTRHKIRLPHRPHPIFREISGYDPCTEKYAEAYYNRPDVQKALHANTTKIPFM
ncbi:hypothetical protein RHMOL_Rhmol07G0064200 [Rhododendron molle]|uniref:Uncharacterized protein n=1 Tax=Rhododendron molle TaxID=49168 RepID=A0ACC0MZ52_RHOML|nr:hypothetical protein RHMOL_Rhmol07G0064200 [Rhododendron molle]